MTAHTRPPPLTGMHHLTAITADVAANKRFYTDVLGLRLVKKTVNQDDVSAYHLFYGDGAATPGSDITFFDWPVPRERRGTRAIVESGFRVAGREGLEWWRERFAALDVTHFDIETRAGRQVLPFEDGEGQRLVLVDDGGAGPAHPWDASPVPGPRQLRGLATVTLSVPDLAATAYVLTDILGMRLDPSDPHRLRFEMGDGGPAAELHVVPAAQAQPSRQGAGGVHHVAFRTPDAASLAAWKDHLDGAGIPNSGEVERYYFRSLYFREPSGILFEIATDGPGFAVDEPMETLGEALSLPPFLEARRADIERGLRPL